MNKDCHWIFLLLITTNVATLALCVGYNNEGRLSLQKQKVSLRPLLNDEYTPPIPVLQSTQYRNARHNDRAGSEESQDISVNRRSWIPLIYADEFPSTAREMWVQPVSYRGRFSVKASSPVTVTKRPETFDIPLRKSIRVSHNAPREPSIHTTGYIKEVVAKEVPVHRFTPRPKYTILVDNVKHTTTQSTVNVTTFEDGWRPKRITTLMPNVKPTKASRRLKPIPFTQFSDSKNIEEGEKYIAERPPFNKESIKSHTFDSDFTHDKQTNPSYGADGAFPDFGGKNSDGKDPYFVPSVIYSNKENDGDDALISDLNHLNHKISGSGFKSAIPKDNSKAVGSNKIFIGVEYADSKLHGVKHNTSHEATSNNNNNDNDGNIVQVTDQDKMIPKSTNNKLKDENYEMPSDAMQLTPHNGEKISRYIEPSEEKEAHIHQTKDKNLGNRPSPGSDKDSKSRGSGKQKKEESKIVDIAKSSSQAPYTDIHVNNNNMNSKELPEDAVYFPPIIPDSRRVVGKNITSTIKSASVASTKTLVSNERLIEFNTKQAGKKDNSIDSSNHASSHRKEHTLPKSETTKEFISHSYYSPTPPSLITVSSDNDDSHQLYDSKRTRSKTNRTDTYILEMKPSLFPDKPGSNRPRKPNIKITSAMLAGILIAALIFLGFLTGTMVFVFHQLKFRSRSSKKTDRHKKRATVYAPEYLDEAFAGNTYIHNNIFLPNPQNLEERLSPEMDTTFSVDTDETTQAADHAPTSSSYVNTRNKSIHRHDDIISD